MKYQKKPVIIDAFQLGKDNMPNWFLSKVETKEVILFGTESIEAYIKTLEGPMRASNGDFIIKGVFGELCVCKPDIFRRTYDELPSDFIPRDQWEDAAYYMD